MSAASLPVPAAAPLPEVAPAQSDPAQAPAPPAEPAKRRGVKVPLVSTRIAGKIIAPYLIVILLLALFGIYIVTQLVTNTIQGKLLEKLRDSGTATNEAMVKVETEFLQTLRLMTNTEGVAEALSAKDIDKLTELLLPLQVNAKLDLVDVIASDGTMVLALRGDELRQQAQAGQLHDDKLGQQQIVQNVLNGVTDSIGDKYTALVATSWGHAIYAASPVKIEDRVVGAVLIGTPLERGVGRLAREAQVSLTLYGADGKLLATTLPAQDLLGVGVVEGSSGSAGAPTAATLEITAQQATDAVGSQPVLVRRALQLKTRLYQELIGALEIRATPAAAMGVALPSTFVAEAAFASRVQIISMFAIVVLGVLAMGLALARAITTPITRLVRATEVVATGNLEAVVPVTTSDEVGRLTESFNHMVSGLREREKIRNMFSQFVTGAVAEAVLQGKVKLGGARQDISVLMSDIRSFTTLSEEIEAEHLVSMLNRYFNHMIDAVLEFDGTLDKFIGDAVMAEFNCPLEQDRHELRAVLCALRMREYLHEFNRDQMERGEKTIRIGIGVHSGPAVVGNVGAEGKKLEYTAMGDTVNVSARLESQTKEVNSDIVISSSTFEACKDFVDVGEAMALHVKGRVEPVVAHKLIRLKPGLQLGIHLVEMSYEQVREITAANDDGGTGLYEAERFAAYDPDSVVAPGMKAPAAIAAG